MSFIMGFLARITAGARLWLGIATGAALAILLAFLKGRRAAMEHYERREMERRAEYNRRLARIKAKQESMRPVDDDELYKRIEDGDF